MSKMRAAEKIDKKKQDEKKSKAEKRKEVKKKAVVEKEKSRKKDVRSVREWRKMDEESVVNEKLRNLAETFEKDGKPVETPGMDNEKMRMRMSESVIDVREKIGMNPINNENLETLNLPLINYTAVNSPPNSSRRREGKSVVFN